MLLIIDYKQKRLPKRAYETQTEAFGKVQPLAILTCYHKVCVCVCMQRGMSISGCTALRRVPGKDEFEVLNVRLSCQDAKQTWFHSLSGLKLILQSLQQKWPQQKEAFVLSDGATNYTCTALMASLSKLESTTGVRIVEHCVSEVGGGKNLTDTDFQQVSVMCCACHDAVTMLNCRWRWVSINALLVAMMWRLPSR
jgi:hypothetical protein